MSRAQSATVSADELVAYLRRSMQSAILVEGSDDKRVYRYVEEKLLDLDVDVVVCSGRSTLLAVYERRLEFSHLPVVFVADRDMWYFVGVPNTYIEQIVFTEGYSIENDLYIRELFEELMSAEELAQYRALIERLSRWQAHQLVCYKSGKDTLCDVHLNEICNASEFHAEHLTRIGYVNPPAELVASVLANYDLAIRGKTLFQALLRMLSASKRPSKFSRDNLFELGAKAVNPRIASLLNRTREAFTRISPPKPAR